MKIKKLRNLFLVGLIILLTFTLAACGGKDTPEPQNSEDTAKKVDYPTKEVKMMVPAGAGGTADVAARALAQGFKEATGQPLVIENQAGGAGVPATNTFVKAAPDGYTLAMMPSGQLSLRPLLQETKYAFPKDFTPIIGVGDFQIVFAVKNDAPYNTMSEMVKYYKDNKESLKVGTAGVNTANHLLMELVAKETGLEYRHMPYPDTNQALTAMLGEHIDLAIVNLSNVYAQMNSGTVKLLGVPAAERYENLKDVPTLLEQEINVSGGTTFDIFGPANLPPEITEKLKEAFAKSMESEQFKTFVTNANVYVTKFSAEEVTKNYEIQAKGFAEAIQK